MLLIPTSLKFLATVKSKNYFNNAVNSCFFNPMQFNDSPHPTKGQTACLLTLYQITKS